MGTLQDPADDCISNRAATGGMVFLKINDLLLLATLHDVTPVRADQRLASITFIESYIADEHQRSQVRELNESPRWKGCR